MGERKKFFIIPLEVMNALAAIRGGDERVSLWDVINEWTKGNELHQNQAMAQLEPEQSDFGSYHTHPATPTQNGTGLRRQGKIPRDLRDSE